MVFGQIINTDDVCYVSAYWYLVPGTWYHKRLFGMLCVRNKRVTKYVRTEFQATSDDAKIAANEMDLNLLCIKQATTTATATTERWYGTTGGGVYRYQVPVPANQIG